MGPSLGRVGARGGREWQGRRFAGTRAVAFLTAAVGEPDTDRIGTEVPSV